MLLLSGCGAVGKIGGEVAETVEGGYELVQQGQEKADAYKATIVRDNLERAERQIDFAGDFGSDLDDAGLGWLDRHLRRIADFVCDLDARGIVIEEVATRSPDALARLECLRVSNAPPAPTTAE